MPKKNTSRKPAPDEKTTNHNLCRSVAKSLLPPLSSREVVGIRCRTQSIWQAASDAENGILPAVQDVSDAKLALWMFDRQRNDATRNESRGEFKAILNAGAAAKMLVFFTARLVDVDSVRLFAKREIEDEGSEVWGELLTKLRRAKGEIPKSLIVSLDPPQVTIGGTAHAVTSQGATLMDALVKADGEWINGHQQVNQPSRVISKLPEPVRKLVETKTGAGCRLKREE